MSKCWVGRGGHQKARVGRKGGHRGTVPVVFSPTGREVKTSILFVCGSLSMKKARMGGASFQLSVHIPQRKKANSSGPFPDSQFQSLLTNE